VTALAPVDAFKVEVAARLNRPEKHPWLSRMQQTLAEPQISIYLFLHCRNNGPRETCLLGTPDQGQDLFHTKKYIT